MEFRDALKMFRKEVGLAQTDIAIEDNIDIDWKIAQSVGDSILGSAYVDDDPAVFHMLQRKQEVWGVSDLMLYTENGYCIYANGSTETTDVASKAVYYARKLGKYLSIVESRLIFTVPLDTTLTFHGSEIVAVSVVRDISSFLDDMNFSSFGDTAWIYLTDQGGAVLSSLSRQSTVTAYNVRTFIRDMEITPLDKADTPEGFLSNPKTAVYLLSNDSGRLYGVSAPIMTDAEPMSLFYFVPENAVNSIMSGFSKQLTTISMVIILLFAVVAFAAFMFVYMPFPTTQGELGYEAIIAGLRNNEADKKFRDGMNYAINGVNMKLRGVAGKRARLYEDFADGILNEDEYQFAKSAYDEQWEALMNLLMLLPKQSMCFPTSVWKYTGSSKMFSMKSNPFDYDRRFREESKNNPLGSSLESHIFLVFRSHKQTFPVLGVSRLRWEG